MVVVWRDQPDTLEALRSLRAMDRPVDDVVCIAQQCSEGFLRRLAGPESDDVGDLDEVGDLDDVGQPEGADWLQLVALADNLGFAGAGNLGVALAVEGGADWVLLLNNDATVDRRCLAACLAEADGQEQLAVLGPAIRITDRPDQLWFAGGVHHHWLAFTRHRGLQDPAEPPPPSADVDYISGCCALVSTRAWREVGPFRDDFFLYYEDVEWCVRARHLGWRCRYVGATLCSHALGVSSGQRGSLGLSANTAYYLARNPLRFAIETRGPLLRLSRMAGILVIWGLYNAGRLRHADRSAVSAYLAGTRDALRGRMGPRP